MTSLFIFEVRKDVYADLMSQMSFSPFTVSLSFLEKAIQKALVNPSVLLLCTSKREVVKLHGDRTRRDFWLIVLRFCACHSGEPFTKSC